MFLLLVAHPAALPISGGHQTVDKPKGTVWADKNTLVPCKGKVAAGHVPHICCSKHITHIALQYLSAASWIYL